MRRELPPAGRSPPHSALLSHVTYRQTLFRTVDTGAAINPRVSAPKNRVPRPVDVPPPISPRFQNAVRPEKVARACNKCRIRVCRARSYRYQAMTAHERSIGIPKDHPAATVLRSPAQMIAEHLAKSCWPNQGPFWQPRGKASQIIAARQKRMIHPAAPDLSASGP